ESAILANVNAPDFLERTLAVTGGDKDKPIALICRSGNRSTKAAELLAAQGFTRLYNVREGVEGGGAGPGWLKRGLPVKPCQC
ncbi:MAG: hypothetical protein K2Q10_05875, partial [Rhodospirillales bacterium]|nr:hypothetical protein [Rhodospirillales bacterium]